MKYHIAHMTADGRLHGLNGYMEVIETTMWGLRELGHSVEYGVRTLSDCATNIIFGAQMIPMEVLEKLPPTTIIYNFEQLRGLDLSTIKPQIKFSASHFKVWDYSEGNEAVWKQLNADYLIVPVGYAELLTRIPKAQIQDIDVLMYGMPGPDRLDAFFQLCRSGLKTVFVCGLYGKQRDELISRSKLIANINLYPDSKIFEVVRVSYLLANRKAVVADIDSDTLIEESIRSGVCVSSPSRLIEDCVDLVNDDNRRNALEASGFEAMRTRDIRNILKHALAD